MSAWKNNSNAQKSIGEQLKEQLIDQENDKETNEEIMARNFAWPDYYEVSQREEIGYEIQKLRENKEYTQAQMARYINLEHNQYSCLEQGRRKFDKALLKRIGHVLNNDLNLIVYRACAPKKVKSGLPPAVAMPARLDVSYERIHKVRVDDIDFKLQFFEKEYQLDIFICGAGVVTHKGRISENDLMCQALKHIHSTIKKGG